MEVLGKERLITFTLSPKRIVVILHELREHPGFIFF